MVDHDTIARMAIRLGRGYRQGWATRIPKTHGVEWNWTTASAYAEGQRNAPTFDRQSGAITYATNKMRWTLDMLGDVEVEIEMQTGQSCSVEASALGSMGNTPYIVARVPDLRGLCSHDLWKIDVAITSLCCGDWKPLHHMPPLRVLVDALHTPSTPCAYVYTSQQITARQMNELSTAHPFNEALYEFGRRGGFKKWERLIVRRPTKEGV